VASLARGDDPALTDIVQNIVGELKGQKINRKGSK
jgi:hypothetical protein